MPIHYHGPAFTSTSVAPRQKITTPLADRLLTTWKVTNSQQGGWSGWGWGATTRLTLGTRMPVYVKRGRESCPTPEPCTCCAMLWGGEGAERRQREPDADKFRDLGGGTSGWIRWAPTGVLSQIGSRDSDGGGGRHPITLLHNTWMLWVLEPKSSSENWRETWLAWCGTLLNDAQMQRVIA